MTTKEYPQILTEYTVCLPFLKKCDIFLVIDKSCYRGYFIFFISYLNRKLLGNVFEILKIGRARTIIVQ